MGTQQITAAVTGHRLDTGSYYLDKLFTLSTFINSPVIQVQFRFKEN